jgi:PAS domain S-box-containing protein
VVLAFVPVWPWVGYLVTPGIVQAVGKTGVVGMTTSGYVLSGLAAVFAVTVGGLFDAAPAAGTLGPETVLADLDDAVIVVDRDERIVRVNDAAVETFGLDSDTGAGRDLSSVVGAGLAALSTPESVELDVPGGTRQFEATVSPVEDRRGRQPGHAIVVSDVTRERVRAQRLTVLHRVLRHNLRNEMTRIMGRAEVIATEDNAYTDTAEAILDSADDLVEIGERAREVETMMSVSPAAEEEVTVANLVGGVLGEYRTAYPDATLSVDADESLTVPADGRILSRVLDNLVENALAHNDAPTPVVTVSARVTDDGEAVRVSVADNGPGLPEQEQAVIEAGTESPLEHGSGLGLWAVKWGVVRLGGDLEFTENEPEGTVVTVRLPRVRATAAPVTELIEAD